MMWAGLAEACNGQEAKEVEHHTVSIGINVCVLSRASTFDENPCLTP